MREKYTLFLATIRYQLSPGYTQSGPTWDRKRCT